MVSKVHRNLEFVLFIYLIQVFFMTVILFITQGRKNYLLMMLAFCIILTGALCTAFSKI